MSNSVFLKPDENGNWGSINVIGGGGSFSSLLTFQSGATAIGNGTANDVSGYDVLSLQVTISATASVTFEATVDGTTWSTLQGYTPTVLGQQSSTIGTSGIYRFIVTGIKLFRARISSYTSGTIDVTGYAAKGSFQIPYLTNSYGNADAQSATSLLQGTGSYLLGYNGTNWDRLRVDANKNLKTVSTNNSSYEILQNAATAVGNGTILDVSQYSTLVLNLVFSGTATVTTEGSVDGTNWDAVGGYGLVSSFVNIQNSAFSSNNRVRYYIAGLRYFRARISAYTSGTVDVQAECTSATMPFPSPTINTNADGTGVGYYPAVADYLYGYNGTTWDRVRTVGTGNLRTAIYDSSNLGAQVSSYQDGLGAGYQGLCTMSFNAGFNGANIERVRVGKTFKYIEYLNLPTATATTIWTPAAGKKFRLMGVQFGASAAAQCALRDGTAGSGTAFHMFKVGGADTKDFSLGNGYLSSAANNVLEIYNATGSTVSVWVTAWGTEE